MGRNGLTKGNAPVTLRHDRAARLLALLFLPTIFLVNPWVRGDGVGYYGYARALLIQHNLDFTPDWRNANTSFRMGRVNPDGTLHPDQYTRTGKLDNHFTVGPTLLWAPFLLAAHLGVITADGLGASVSADGFSRPYRIAMAIGTAIYGFLALLLSFQLARRFSHQSSAAIAVLGIWFGSSLPVYMYFNPSWSHAHSAFAVALFVWYWHRTREGRTASQWFLLALLGGLMTNVYYLNAILLLLPLCDAVRAYWPALRAKPAEWGVAAREFGLHVLFVCAFLAAMLPTFITRKIVYGNYFSTGYDPLRTWHWTSPVLLKVLFSSDHGLWTWTPLLFLAFVGLVIFWRRNPEVGGPLLLAALVFYFVVAAYPNWDGLSSFGNRFFVSLTSLFVIGLAALIDAASRAFAQRAALTASTTLLAALILWNCGFIFQWALHLVPPRGPISFRRMAYNQFEAVPSEFVRCFRLYLSDRQMLMKEIEQRDVEQLRSSQQGRQ